jgi:hypothetical protein
MRIAVENAQMQTRRAQRVRALSSRSSVTAVSAASRRGGLGSADMLGRGEGGPRRPKQFSHDLDVPTPAFARQRQPTGAAAISASASGIAPPFPEHRLCAVSSDACSFSGFTASRALWLNGA